MERVLKAIYGQVRSGKDYRSYVDLKDFCREVMKTDIPLAIKYLSLLSDRIEQVMPTLPFEEMGSFFELHHDVVLLGAPHSFHLYLLAVEWKRDPDRKFYPPRRRVLRVLVDDLQDLADHKLDFLGISLPPRVGKLVSDDTKVLTKEGWKNHGDLCVGDYVISPNGNFVKVTHVFPKNLADVRVKFTDGTHVDVHENHEWVVYNRHKGKYEVVETKAMFDDYEVGIPGHRGHRYFYQLPLKNYVKGEVKKLPVPAYTFGAWLGDGTNTNPRISIDHRDRPIVERIIADGYAVASYNVHKETGVEYFAFDKLRFDLQKIGMCHSRQTCPKHIPQEYLIAPIQHRLALLAGLLDTDGCLQSKRYFFSTTEPQLRDDFISLISTFGWRCSVAEHAPTTSSSGIVGRRTVWTISFHPDCPIPCQLERKQIKEFAERRRTAICGFERIDPKPGNCISVEGGVYCVGERLIPTHNSTLCIFFMTWMMGRNPDVANVMSGHSDKLTDGFYRELLSIIKDTSQYDWTVVFPNVPIADTSAKNETIDLNHTKRFPTMTCRSIGGTLTGAVEIGSGGVLYCDDLVEDLEESLNPARLDAKYNAYLNQLKDRKKLGALELMVGTRWNVFDPLGRIQDQYEGNERYRFRVIPALNEDDESNFNYEYGVGFDTAYYHDMRDSIDPATWNAKYQGAPYIREGLLFPEDELLTYNGVLPDGDPEKVVVCDVAWGGGDSLSMPIVYKFGEDVYIHDVVFNKGDKSVTYPVVIGRIKQHLPHKARFEANNGGHEYADNVDKALRKDGVHIHEVALNAITEVDIPEDVSVSISEELHSYQVDLADYDGKLSVAEILQKCANASGCVLYQDRKGVLTIEKLRYSETGYIIPLKLSPSYPKVELSRSLKNVSVTYGVEGVYLLPCNDSGETQTVENDFILTENQAAIVAEWVADGLRGRKTISGEFRSDPRIDLFDVLRVENKYGTVTGVAITDIKYSFSGAFRASYSGQVRGTTVPVYCGEVFSGEVT